MWQIGIDVLPEYRGNRVASTLVSKLTDIIIGKGIVPYYGTSWSNIASIRTAASSGYQLAWVEMTAIDIKKHPI